MPGWILALSLYAASFSSNIKSSCGFSSSYHNVLSSVPSTTSKKNAFVASTIAKRKGSDISMSQSMPETPTLDEENSEEEKDLASSSENKRPKWMKCINGVAPRTGPLNECVSKIAGVTLEQANDLIAIGAVWAKMDVLTEEEILDQYYGTSDNAKISYADLAKGWNSDRYLREEPDDEDLEEFIERMESRRYNRIMSPCVISSGTDLRIYPFPRRFPAAKLLDETRLLHEDTTFLIVDKPPMLPTQPDASNYFENCPGAVAMNLGPFQTLEGEEVERPLLCHRVDSCVSGAVVLSKDGNGQAVFSRLQRERKVKKVYKAVTKAPVPTGMHIHWMWGEMTKRGNAGGPPCQLVSHVVPLNRKKAKAWIRCILEVVKSEPITVKKDNEYGYDPGDEQHYENTIRLVTGRKHQVRAQLASLGAPIIRDTLYEPIGGMTLDLLNSGGEEAMLMDMAVERCRVPQHPIGLQAHAILFGGIKGRAGTPWWGDGSGK